MSNRELPYTREDWLRIQIDDLAFERVKLPEYKSAEEIISAIRNIMEILNQQFFEEDICGFILEWDAKTCDFSLRTYPSEVFPNCFYLGGEKEQKIAKTMSQTKCLTYELTIILQFFDKSRHVNLEITQKHKGNETYKLRFK